MFSHREHRGHREKKNYEEGGTRSLLISAHGKWRAESVGEDESMGVEKADGDASGG
jgi:hypothetical protein